MADTEEMVNFGAVLCYLAVPAPAVVAPLGVPLWLIALAPLWLIALAPVMCVAAGFVLMWLGEDLGWGP